MTRHRSKATSFSMSQRTDTCQTASANKESVDVESSENMEAISTWLEKKIDTSESDIGQKNPDQQHLDINKQSRHCNNLFKMLANKNSEFTRSPSNSALLTATKTESICATTQSTGATNEANGASTKVNGATKESNGATNEAIGATNESNEADSATNKSNGSTSELNGVTNELNSATNEVNGTTSEVIGATNKSNGATNKLNGANNDVIGATNELNSATNEVNGANNKVIGATNESNGAAASLSASCLSGSTEAELHTCSVCSIRFSTAYRLRLHQARHTPGVFECAHCGTCVGYLRNMQVHLRSKHNVNIRVCGVCNKKFPVHDDALDHDCPDDRPEARHYSVLSLDPRDRPSRKSSNAGFQLELDHDSGAASQQRPKRLLKRPPPSSPPPSVSATSDDEEDDNRDASLTATSSAEMATVAKRPRRSTSVLSSSRQDQAGVRPSPKRRPELRRKAVTSAAASAAVVAASPQPPAPVLVQSAADVVAPFLNSGDRFRHPFALPWEPIGGPDGVEGRRRRWLAKVFKLAEGFDSSSSVGPVRPEGRVLAVRHRLGAGVDEPPEVLVSWAWRPDFEEEAIE
ncbi:hypothetical protein BOX15_Mlig002120g3 [Macrostomum lignano]|uniref:C2H2-type domain-containing protein n=2 Tax=Macrostomum lignano TaxID=282301 RepID=A0A267ET13_9PLAT|nr:hypothetical protein BOX15_Mlig002120g3 [Macrostomum lignano]